MNTIVYFLNTNSGAIQAISTAILVVITIYYAYQTRKTVVEAEHLRKDSRLPIVRVSIEGPFNIGAKNQPKYIAIYLNNIGYGLAQNVKLIFPKKGVYKVRNLDNEEEGISSVQIILEDNEDDVLCQLPDEQKIISIDYEDIFGRKVSTTAHFILDQTVEWTRFGIIDWRLVLPD
jgi:hypothetical protein